MEINEKQRYWWHVESISKEDKYVPGIDFMLKGEDVQYICHCGPNDAEVGYVMQKHYVKKQLQKMRNEFLKGVIREYGDDVLKNYNTRNELKMFLVWYVAWMIYEDELYGEECENAVA